jgi:DNA-binding MarR family transcriptional regulator
MKIPSFLRNKKISFVEDAIYNTIKKWNGDFDLKNIELAEGIGMDRSSIVRIINNLKAANLIYEHSFDGHRRVLKAREMK